MNLKEKIVKAIKDPRKVVLRIITNNWSRLIPSKIYLKIIYRLTTGKRLELSNPKTYNEKLQWLKLYDRKPKYTKLVDKYEVREYIAKVLGEDYLIPLIGAWESFDEVDFSALPNRFVLKCTHDSASVVICTDKTKLDKKMVRKKISRSLKRNYYYPTREWPYKDVNPKIICERYLEQEDGEELRDYRFFCFNGEPKFITVDFSIVDKTKTRRNVYDLDWNLMDVQISYPQEKSIEVRAPKKLNEMIMLSRKLSKDFSHVRIDFYYINNQVLFGELTFFHQSGMGKILPQEFDYKMGSWIEIKK